MQKKGKLITGKIIFFSVLTLVFLGCRPLIRPASQNYAHIYQSTLNYIRPQYHVFHQNAHTSQLHITVSSDDLLYTREDIDGSLIARFQVSCYLYESLQSRKLTDSISVVFTDSILRDESREIIRTINLEGTPAGKSILFVELTDLKRRANHRQILPLNKAHAYTSSFFILTADDGSAAHAPFFLTPGMKYTATYPEDKNFSMQAGRYSIPQAIPFPAHVMDNSHSHIPDPWEADSVFTLSFMSGQSAPFSCKPGEMYFFHQEGFPEHGFAAYCFQEGFPSDLHADYMLLPMRYITSSDEYNQLFDLGDAELALERFWTRSAGNPDRAFEIMHRYNARVVNANTLFTSFVPGWQTDRGMIYIIFGPPQRVYKEHLKETWIYHEGVNIPQAQFVFNLVENRYSDNHFLLERNTAFRSTWNHAVNIWRR